MMSSLSGVEEQLAAIRRVLERLDRRSEEASRRVAAADVGASEQKKAYYTRIEAAVRLGVSVKTLSRMVRRGEILAVPVSKRLQRIPAEELDLARARPGLGSSPEFGQRRPSARERRRKLPAQKSAAERLKERLELERARERARALAEALPKKP